MHEGRQRLTWTTMDTLPVMSTTATCTAPVNGHLPGSPAAAKCPAHKAGASNPSVALAVPVPRPLARSAPSVDLSDFWDPVTFCRCGKRMTTDEKDGTSHHVARGEDGTDDIVDREADDDHVATIGKVIELDDLCSRCMTETLDDGEGYDGLCGSCADQAERSGRWS